jgi:hypothetical protein
MVPAPPSARGRSDRPAPRACTGAVVKLLTEMLWTLVRWTLPLTAAGIVVALALGRSRVDEELRARAEARLQAMLPSIAVQVRAAGIVAGQGITLWGVSLIDPALPPRSRQMAWIDELHLACGTTLAELAAGPQVTALRLRRPVVHAVRDAEGLWNLAGLRQVRAGDAALVPVLIEDATVVIDDTRLQQRLTVRHVGADLRPSSDGVFEIRGSGTGDGFNRIGLGGRIGGHDGAFELAGTVEAIDLGPRLLAGSVGVNRALASLSGLRGRLGVEYRLAGSLRQIAATDFRVIGRLDAGHFQHPSLPFPLSDVAATFSADRGGLVCDRLEARAAATVVRGSGRLLGWSESADGDLVIEAERLHVGRHWEAVLPPELATHWSRLLPAGEIDLRAQLVRRGGQVDPEVAIRCRNVSLTHYRFPHRLDRTVGTVILRQGTLSLHLTGQAGGHAVHVDGAIDTSVAGGRGMVEVRGEGLRIDDSLLVAMPARSADILRRLRASGTFDFHFRHQRDPEFPGGSANLLDVQVSHGSLNYTGFPYPLSNVKGALRMEGSRWTIRELVGSNDTGVVRCTGVLDPLGDRDHALTLHLSGRGVVLEPELRDALPPGMQRIWDDLDPRGAAAFTATVRHQASSRRTSVELQAVPEGDSVSIEPAWFPYRLERLRGRLHWQDGLLRFEQIRGEHDRTVVATEGRCRFTPDGGWHVAFERLSADRFRVDHDLLQALPAGLREAVAGVRLHGLLSLDGAIDIYSTAATDPSPTASGRPATGPAAASWDMHLDMAQAAFDLGVPVEHVHGGVRLRGQSDGTTWRAEGELALDSATLRGVQLTSVRGPLAMDADGVRFGAPAATAGGLRRLTAELAGGTLLLDGSARSGEAGGFSVSAAIRDADLQRLASEASGVGHRSRGRLEGTLDLTGSRAGSHSLVGRGQVRLRDAELYELPVIVALLKMLRVKAPDRKAFSGSVIDFRVEGPHGYLDSIELAGDAISLVGAGEVDFDGGIRMTFRSIMGDSATQLPAMKRLLGGASGQFMLIHVDGTLAEPVSSTEAFPTLAAALQQLQARQPSVVGTRTALRP